MKRKYVIYKGKKGEFALVFPTFIQHNGIKVVRYEPVSAGFVDISVKDGDFKVVTYGMSISLKLKSREDDDKIVLKTINNALVI